VAEPIQSGRARKAARINRRSATIWGLVALVGLAVAGFIVFALLEGDIPDAFGDGVASVRPLLRRSGPIGAVALLYLEESGVPMPVPGDVFVMYVGHHVSGNLVAMIGAWLGLIAAVLLGATNLYFISRRWGRQLVDRRLGRVLHMTPERIATADRWFKRWGALALIFGRHIPGFRVPLTVGAGIFNVGYPVFAASVAVSTAIWAGVFLIIGATLGSRAGRYIGLHRETYLLIPIVIVGFVLYFAYRVWQTRAPHPAHQD
jgi:membrane protein DedA with SNARE-associated domain